MPLVTLREKSRLALYRQLKRAGGVVAALLALVLVWNAVKGLPDRFALRQALGAPEFASMKDGYEDRGFNPIWLHGKAARPEARTVLDAMAAGRDDGLNAQVYDAAALKLRLGNLGSATRADRIKAELLMSSAYSRYIKDLHTPAKAADLLYTDDRFKPPFRDARSVFQHLAGSGSAQDAIDEATRMSPLYVAMRTMLLRYRLHNKVEPEREGLLLLNLDRLRAMPGDSGERFVVVDAASNRLWAYEDDEPVRGMKVIVGTPAHETPQMAALIRYAVFNPVWNVPPDLARDTYAPRILARPSALEEMRMDAWSGFAPGAVRLISNQVNWQAVASGQETAWLRQRAGGSNAMGKVKFMLPNTLGIYLHDTPEPALFQRSQRFFSAGCVRVEDAAWLSQWLNQGRTPNVKAGKSEQRVDLPDSVPVYILYLTAIAENDGISLFPDVYGRDKAIRSKAPQ